MHSITRDLLVGLVSCALFSLMMVAAYPWIHGFVGDWKVTWDDFAHRRGRTFRIFLELYRIKRRTRRARLLVRLHKDPAEILRYLIFPVYSTAIALLGSFPPPPTHPLFAWRYAGLLLWIPTLLRLAAMLQWLFALLTLAKSGDEKLMERYVDKTEHMFQKFETFVSPEIEAAKSQLASSTAVAGSPNSSSN